MPEGKIHSKFLEVTGLRELRGLRRLS